MFFWILIFWVRLLFNGARTVYHLVNVSSEWSSLHLFASQLLWTLRHCLFVKHIGKIHSQKKSWLCVDLLNWQRQKCIPRNKKQFYQCIIHTWQKLIFIPYSYLFFGLGFNINFFHLSKQFYKIPRVIKLKKVYQAESGH